MEYPEYIMELLDRCAALCVINSLSSLHSLGLQPYNTTIRPQYIGNPRITRGKRLVIDLDTSSLLQRVVCIIHFETYRRF